MHIYTSSPLTVCHVVENHSPGVVASQSVEHPEKVSIGGDSVASSEYETISMFEETGTPDQYKSTCYFVYVLL